MGLRLNRKTNAGSRICPAFVFLHYNMYGLYGVILLLYNMTQPLAKMFAKHGMDYIVK